MNGVHAKTRGVKGWLLFLCVSLSILDPLATLLYLTLMTAMTKQYFDTSPQLMRLMLIHGTCGIGLAVFSIYAGLSLWRILPGAVNTAKRYLVIAMVYSCITPFLPYIVGLPEDFDESMKGNNLLNSLLTMSYMAVWYTYLQRSKRVQATYQETNNREE